MPRDKRPPPLRLAPELLTVVVNPIAVKAALNLLGHDVGGHRLPLVEATEDEPDRVRDCLERLGLLAAAHIEAALHFDDAIRR